MISNKLESNLSEVNISDRQQGVLSLMLDLTHAIEHQVTKKGRDMVTRDLTIDTIALGEHVSQHTKVLDQYERLVFCLVNMMEEEIIEDETEWRQELEEERQFRRNHQPTWKPDNQNS